MDALIMTAQILLSLSILVGLHELGHLVAAKFFGMRVEKFSIGFPPKIFGVNWGETEYSIGAIPLGGFVKISGMIDESLDTESLSEEPEEWEFRAKPAWQRLIVMIGGIVVNIVLGVLIFIGLIYAFGESDIPKTELDKYGIVAFEHAENIGLKTGDKIVNINGNDFEGFSDLRSPDVLLGTDSYYTVSRNGEEVKIDIPGDLIETLSDKDAISKFMTYRTPFEVGEVGKGTGAEKGGLKAGDKIILAGNSPINFHDEIGVVSGEYKGKDLPLKVKREEELIDLTVAVDTLGKLGFFPKPTIIPSYKKYSFSASIPKGTTMAFDALWINVRAFGKMFKGELDPTKSLQGPIGIAKVFGGTWDWFNFWRITGLLSMVLAFMNFLPIPALDGGHVAFLGYEIISGRKPSDKFLENSQKVGMVILLTLMVFVFGNDIVNLF